VLERSTRPALVLARTISACGPVARSRHGRAGHLRADDARQRKHGMTRLDVTATGRIGWVAAIGTGFDHQLWFQVEPLSREPRGEALFCGFARVGGRLDSAGLGRKMAFRGARSRARQWGAGFFWPMGFAFRFQFRSPFRPLCRTPPWPKIASNNKPVPPAPPVPPFPYKLPRRDENGNPAPKTTEIYFYSIKGERGVRG
jgi:hypothetical protein